MSGSGSQAARPACKFHPALALPNLLGQPLVRRHHQGAGAGLPEQKIL